MIQIPVAVLEFDENGHTIWVHNKDGMTVLRIKGHCINVHKGCVNLSAHADITVDGDIDICIPSTRPKRKKA